MKVLEWFRWQGRGRHWTTWHALVDSENGVRETACGKRVDIGDAPSQSRPVEPLDVCRWCRLKTQKATS